MSKINYTCREFRETTATDGWRAFDVGDLVFRGREVILLIDIRYY